MDTIFITHGEALNDLSILATGPQDSRGQSLPRIWIFKDDKNP
jgi:hypothetical protein